MSTIPINPPNSNQPTLTFSTSNTPETINTYITSNVFENKSNILNTAINTKQNILTASTIILGVGSSISDLDWNKITLNKPSLYNQTEVNNLLSAKESILTFNAPLTRSTNTIGINLNSFVPFSALTSSNYANYGALNSCNYITNSTSGLVNYYDKTTSDGRYAQSNFTPSFTQLNSCNYITNSTTGLVNYYDKTTSDGRYTQSNFTPSFTQLNSCNYITNATTGLVNYYDKTTSDGRYTQSNFTPSFTQLNSCNYITNAITGLVNYYDKTTSDGRFVLKSGDNITGNLGIGIPSPNCKLYISANLTTSATTYAMRISSGQSTDNGGFGTLIGLGSEPNGWSKCAVGHTRMGSYDRGDIVFLCRNTTDGVSCSMSDEKMRINSVGNVGINNTNPVCKLDVVGIANIHSGTRYAVNNNQQTKAGSLTIGGTDVNYGGNYYPSGAWTGGDTAGILMECLNNTEIAVHDSSKRVASLLYYEGDTTNTITIGRDMGWDANVGSKVFIGGNTGGRDKLLLWKNTATNFYGFGIEVGTLTYSADTNHRWYNGSAAVMMTLDNTGNLNANSFSINNNNITSYLFNNTGANHGDIGNFNSVSTFGYKFILGNTNGPGTFSSISQYYSWYIGLGIDYGANLYGCQFALPRNTGLPELSVRFKENGTWGSWGSIQCGSIRMPLNIWGITTTDGNQRFGTYNNTTLLRGFPSGAANTNSFEFRNSADSAILGINDNGNAFFANQITCKLILIPYDPHDFVGIAVNNAATGNYTLYIIQGSFTGFHRYFTNDELFDENEPQLFKDDYEGRIVVSTGKIATQLADGIAYDKEGIRIEDSHSIIQLSRNKKDKRVIGVIGDKRRKTENNKRIIVNGVGEGAIWVCNSNGNIENGDLITTSDYLGYGEKQDDDLLHNYTCAKATIDCNFELDSPYYECKEIDDLDANGNKLRIAFISVIYHCG